MQRHELKGMGEFPARNRAQQRKGGNWRKHGKCGNDNCANAQMEIEKGGGNREKNTCRTYAG